MCHIYKIMLKSTCSHSFFYTLIYSATFCPGLLSPYSFQSFLCRARFTFSSINPGSFLWSSVFISKIVWWVCKTIISNLVENTGEQLHYKRSFTWHFVTVDCIESEWTASATTPHPPGVALPPLFLSSFHYFLVFFFLLLSAFCVPRQRWPCLSQGWGPAVVWTGETQGWKDERVGGKRGERRRGEGIQQEEREETNWVQAETGIKKDWVTDLTFLTVLQE